MNYNKTTTNITFRECETYFHPLWKMSDHISALFCRVPHGFFEYLKLEDKVSDVMTSFVWITFKSIYCHKLAHGSDKKRVRAHERLEVKNVLEQSVGCGMCSHPWLIQPGLRRVQALKGKQVLIVYFIFLLNKEAEWHPAGIRRFNIQICISF